MLVCYRNHAHALCQISVSELRRVAPTVFSFFMVISILLADGLFPVYASKYRTPASVYLNSNVVSSASTDAVLYMRKTSDIRYRTKTKVKTPVSTREDSAINGGLDIGNSNFASSHVHLQLDDIDSSRRIDERNERGINDNKNRVAGKTYVELDKATSGSPSVSSFKSSSSSPLDHSYLIFSNSSNRMTESSSRSKYTISAFYPNEPEFNRCSDVQHFSSKSPQEMCDSLAKSSQCLVFNTKLAKTICSNCQTNERIEIIRKVRMRLRFCSSYEASSVSCASYAGAGKACKIEDSPSICLDYLQNIVSRDDEVERMYAGFLELYNRYDCNNNYSVKWYCRHCKQAYKDWLCSQNINFYRSDQIVPPCTEFCSHVEEMCPFFRPKLESYAGDHSFICKDPHMNSPISNSLKNCYGLCDLWTKPEVSDFFCSHGNLHGANCPLLKTCEKILESIDYGSNSTNTTSGSNSVNIVQCTFLQLLPMLTSLIFFSFTLTKSSHISEGFT